MRSRLPRRLALFVLVTAVALGLGEAVVRLAYGSGGAEDFSFEPMNLSVTEERGRFQRHPRRFFELAPEYVHGARHLGRYSLGQWNFRNTPPEPLAPGRLRVVVLGDSCMYGVGVDAADTVPARLARELAARGLGYDQVQVLNLGVPGYSTVQIEAMLDEALERWDPDAVVFYPAAWNDQSPNVWRNDLQLEQDANDPSLWMRVRRVSRLAALVAGRLESVDTAAVVEQWAAGDPPLGHRVPADETDRRLERMFTRVRDLGLASVVITPVHPDSTQTAHPRVDRDARAVRRLGEELGLPVVGGPLDGLDERSAENDRLFVDYAHHSPEGTALLAGQAAEALAPQLAARLSDAAGAGGLVLESVEPTELSTFGDATLSVVVRGLRPDDPTPQVLLGGAPLLDVEREDVDGATRLTGWVMANAAGLQDVVVQAAQGTVAQLAAVTRVEPWLEFVAGDPPRLRFHARADDQVRVFVGTALRDAPLWSHRGAFRLADGFVELGDLVAGPDGVGELVLPADTVITRAFVQGAAVPRGDPLGDSYAARWTPLLRVE